MRECDRHDLTPMLARGKSHFYVDELAQLDDGSFVIPQMWVTFKGEVCAMCVPVLRTEVRETSTASVTHSDCLFTEWLAHTSAKRVGAAAH
jgi:hypothetical protein